MSKKIISVFMAALLAAACLTGCGQAAETQEASDPAVPDGQAGTAQEGGTESNAAPAGEPAAGGTAPVVYMTTDISSEGLMAVYEALEASPTGNVAVKLSTGEPGSNYLRTDLIGELVQSLDATIVECNTAYGGSRANTAMHYQVAEDHGYTAIADVDIMDEEGSITLPVTGGDNLTENYVGSILKITTTMWCSPTSRATLWPVTAGLSRISPSASRPPRARPISTPAAPAAACGAAIRMLFWNLWRRPENLWRTRWTAASSTST